MKLPFTIGPDVSAKRAKASKKRFKVCPICGRRLPMSEFMYIESGYVNQRGICADCEKERIRKYERERYKKVRAAAHSFRGVRMCKGRLSEFRGAGRPAVYWTSAMLAELKRLFPMTQTEFITARLGIGRDVMHRKAKELGLTRDPEFFKRATRIRAQKIRDAARLRRFLNGKSKTIKAADKTLEKIKQERQKNIAI